MQVLQGVNTGSHKPSNKEQRVQDPSHHAGLLLERVSSSAASRRPGLGLASISSTTTTVNMEGAQACAGHSTHEGVGSSEVASSPSLVPKHGEVYYFAYGSNMSPKVLTDRRKVAPKASRPCKVDGYTLAFNYRGIPFTEPGMATIMRSDTLPDRSTAGQYQNGTASSSRQASAAAAGHAACLAAGLHGVVHLITDEEWQKVKQTEGVGAAHVGYQVVRVKCELYDGQWVMAETLEAAPLSLGDPSTVLPSLRYIQILRDGARHHGVDPAYCDMLDAQPGYVIEGWRQKAGKIVIGVCVLIMFLPMVLVALVMAGASWLRPLLGGRTPGPQAGAVSSAASAAAATAVASVTTSVTAASGKGGEKVAAPGGALGAALMRVRLQLSTPLANYYVWAVFWAAWLLHALLRPLFGSGCDMSVAAAAAAPQRSAPTPDAGGKSKVA